MAFGFLGVLSLFVVLDLLWWRIVDRRLRGLRRAGLWRWVLAIAMMALIAYVASARFFLGVLGRSQGPIPMVVHAGIYLWHFLILPLTMLCLLSGAIARWILRKVRRSRPMERNAGNEVQGAQDAAAGAATLPPAPPMARSPRVGEPALTLPRSPVIVPTRRQVIATAAMALPPLAAVVGAVGAVRTMSAPPRIRPFDLTIPGLPAALDGMTIAHISDTHIGKFLHRDRLPAIAEQVNRLDADFVVFTGDLIDLALDDLKFGIDFLHSLRWKHGMAICEGNHDLMEDSEAFETRMRAELPLIIGGEKTYVRNGSSVQFLAVPWTLSEDERDFSILHLAPAVDDSAFRILLAHHPHTFDAAAATGKFPLILSGHTHGGQLMVNDQFGIGSVRFRYTSGLYQKPGSSLIVNNGLGNWFPLRVNAPTEIVHIRLQSSPLRA